MRSKFLLAGGALSVVLTAAAVLGAVQEWWWLVVAAGMVLLSVTLIIAMDADRRARALRPYIRGEVSKNGKSALPPALEAPPVSEVDVVGTVRVLQAQFTGRLDRMQASLDQAVAQLRDVADREPSAAQSPPTPESDQA
ncbi:hypothetical protein [Ornithinimicrobium cavernae]|uniref:hypothetical protein n=1 Tax=Ornithinimicrobium cavernae TaxID=2666047 RepID=UPI000D69FE8E|nr:hypothetical protein [Ornithinimicrobium cavernae]